LKYDSRRNIDAFGFVQRIKSTAKLHATRPTESSYLFHTAVDVTDVATPDGIASKIDSFYRRAISKDSGKLFECDQR
jgi:hypothetical protein